MFIWRTISWILYLQNKTISLKFNHKRECWKTRYKIVAYDYVVNLLLTPHRLFAKEHITDSRGCFAALIYNGIASVLDRRYFTMVCFSSSTLLYANLQIIFFKFHIIYLLSVSLSLLIDRKLISVPLLSNNAQKDCK